MANDRGPVRRAALALPLLLTLGLGAAAAAPVSPDLDRSLRGLVDERAIPGAVALLARDGEVVATSVVGWRDVAEAKPMTEDTIFRLYSMSKPITSVAILMLAEEGALALEDPVDTFLPELANLRVYVSGDVENMVTEPAGHSPTIAELLTHTSGITYHFTGTTPVHAWYRRHGVLRDTPVGRTPEDGPPARSLGELVRRIGEAPLLHQPGARFAYSYSTTVLGAVIERISGQSLDVFLEERIFAPLGMTGTGFFVSDADLDRFVTNYTMTDEGLREIESPESSDYRDHSRLLDGGGAIAGTARDYLRFARMLANGGELDGVRLLSAQSAAALFVPRVRLGGPDSERWFGYGFAVGDAATEAANELPEGAVGWSGSGNTFFWLWPGTGDVVVLMTQVITPPDVGWVRTRLRQAVLESWRGLAPSAASRAAAATACESLASLHPEDAVLGLALTVPFGSGAVPLANGPSEGNPTCSKVCLEKVMADFISTRLKIEAGQIIEVELSADVGRVNPDYVWNLPSALTDTIPEKQRATREALDALGRRYFQSLTDHKGIAADFDDERCNRFHSGKQITNVSRSAVEGPGARTCLTSIDGPKPWGPAVEQRFPVIDVEHGIVMGITLLMYADQVMYVSEIFKVENGRITHIDNIGLVKPGLEHTTGFGTRRLRREARSESTTPVAVAPETGAPLLSASQESMRVLALPAGTLSE